MKQLILDFAVGTSELWWQILCIIYFIIFMYCKYNGMKSVLFV